MEMQRNGGLQRREDGAVERDEDTNEIETRDWWASIRLATIFSVVAAVAAVLTAGRLPETTFIVTIIVIGTMLSWMHVEGVPATVRHPRHHRR
jgi:hypothetical protein